MHIVLCVLLASSVSLSAVPLARAEPLAAVRLAPSQQVDDIIEALQQAEQQANSDPSAGSELLREALERYRDLGRLVARDAKAHEARLYGLLALARALLALGDEDEANAVMDEAIRVARGDPLPAKMFGPHVEALHQARRSAPENRPEGQIHVTCDPACDVVLDARLAGSGHRVDLMDVPLGAHRLLIHATGQEGAEILDRPFTLTKDEPSLELEFASTGGEAVPAAETTTTVDAGHAGSRRLPRWAGIVGLATGAAAMIAGGVLLGFHGRCPDGSDPLAPDACINVLDTKVTGISLLAVGGAVFTGFGVALVIGETRDRKRRTAGAMLGYTWRF